MKERETEREKIERKKEIQGMDNLPKIIILSSNKIVWPFQGHT